jgi:hypothetical protein
MPLIEKSETPFIDSFLYYLYLPTVPDSLGAQRIKNDSNKGA